MRGAEGCRLEMRRVRTLFPKLNSSRVSGVSGFGATVDKGGAKKGEVVLVTAAAGGSGQFAVQVREIQGV
jgi:NADPH-dependent curcumin reductase CurA